MFNEYFQSLWRKNNDMEFSLTSENQEYRTTCAEAFHIHIS